jgi:hypothetical protein
METSAFYYRFNPPNGTPTQGIATVTLSRVAACGGYAPSRITIRLSRLRVTPEPNAQPVAGRLLALRKVTLRSTPCQTKTISFSLRTPYRIDLSTPDTFLSPDGRQLSAQVTFGFRAKK